MLATLPRPVAAYVRATNSRDSAALAAAFALDAVVQDDAHTYQGRPAIHAWGERNVHEYATFMEVTGAEQQAGQIIVTSRISGTFDGSPLLFRHMFTCTNDEITSLRIEHIG